MKSIYEYRNIVIDTDLEPDDKAALEIFFRGLANAKTSPGFVMPQITILTGSSTRPALKTLQLVKMIEIWKPQAIIDTDFNIEVIQGSATSKRFAKDGYDLLDESIVKAVEQDPSFKILPENVEKIAKILQQENSVYVGMREVSDLCQILDRVKTDGLNDRMKVAADFMGTLSFNVTQPFLVRGQEVNGGPNKFVEYLALFNNSYCYDNFNSACDNNSTGKIWPEIRDIIAQHPFLLKSHQLWDADNIDDCYRTLSDTNYDGNKVHILGLTAEQAQNAKQLFEEVLEKRKQGVFQSMSIDAIDKEIEDFKSRILTAFGPEAKSKIEVNDSSAFQAFKFNFNPFANMVFYSPQLCFADICFMTVVTNPDLFKASVQPKALSYNGRFSKLGTENPNTNYIILSQDQLKAGGAYACNLMRQDMKSRFINVARAFVPGFDGMSATAINSNLEALSAEKVKKYSF